MYKIVLKVPEIVFFIFIFLPIFLIIGGYYPDAMTGMILSVIGLFTGIFWMLGISSYMDQALGIKKVDWMVIIFLILFSFSGLRDLYQNFLLHPLFFNFKFTFPVFTILFSAIAGILLALKVKKVFFARSLWFTVFEIMAYPFGVATLTPEIKNHYRENKRKMDKILEGESNEDLLN